MGDTRTSSEDRQNPPNRSLEPTFLTGVPVEIRKVSQERYEEDSRLWYKIEIRHGDFNWNVYKILANVRELETTLKSFEKVSNLFTGRNGEDSNKPTASENTPRLTLKNLPLDVDFYEFNNRGSITEAIKEYLAYVTQHKVFKFHPAVSNFFNLSGYSFNPGLGKKGREGLLDEKLWYSYWGYWRKRWFVVKESFVMSLDSRKRKIKEVFLFDRHSAIMPSEDSDTTLHLTNSSTGIEIQCPDQFQANVWKARFEKRTEKFRSGFEQSDVGSIASFAPSRHAPVHWFIDGSTFFVAIADAIEKAKEEIYITDFVLGPFVYMRRSNGLKEENNLLTILKRKADEGIKIYILLYDDVKMASNQGQAFAKEVLDNLNAKNICCVAHRGEVLEGGLAWSHHEKLVVVDQGTAFVSVIDLAYGRWDDHNHVLTDIGSPTPSHGDSEAKEDDNDMDWNAVPGQLWRGIDYTNIYQHTISDFTKPFIDQMDRQKVPRSPWHDVGSVTYHEAARDVARHFIERWNYVRTTDQYGEETIPFLLPKAQPSKEEKSSYPVHPLAVEAKVQVIRSAAKWSVGVEETEMSIHDAYLKKIQLSECYIYIENQFFISMRGHPDVRNKIVEALYQRILRAKTENKKFRLYVVMPLLPGFEGEFGTDKDTSLLETMCYYQNKSIRKGEGSLIGALESIMTEDEVKNFVSFCALRSHGELNGEPITEVLYVHSKVMIVDDKCAIIGSANINDRSLNGDRDSEVCLLIEDTQMIDSVMDGKKYKVGKFSSTFRKRLFAEHLGLLPKSHDDTSPDFRGSGNLNDILSDKFFNGTWNKIATSNTNIYTEVGILSAVTAAYQ